VRRRDFIAGITGSAATWPLIARAQQSDRVRRIGVLTAMAAEAPDTKARLAAFGQALERLGWSEARNIRTEYRFGAAQFDRYEALARELVAAQPDVILAQTTPVAIALQRVSRTIPTVFVYVSDPVGAGLIASLARPAGNFTGMLLYEEGIVGKWLTMLKEIAPRLTQVAFLANSKSGPYAYFLRYAQATATSLAVELVPTPVANAADIESAIESFARRPNSGLFLSPDITTVAQRDLIVALTARHRLPAVYAFRDFVTAGGLMSYGTDENDTYRLAASYVDRILRGAMPAELPVQAPVKYETLLNLKAAKALGLEVPPAMLVRADEVIE
jgi:putative ABC transport system substrate-binding protein